MQNHFDERKKRSVTVIMNGIHTSYVIAKQLEHIKTTHFPARTETSKKGMANKIKKIETVQLFQDNRFLTKTNYAY